MGVHRVDEEGRMRRRKVSRNRGCGINKTFDRYICHAKKYTFMAHNHQIWACVNTQQAFIITKMSQILSSVKNLYL